MCTLIRFNKHLFTAGIIAYLVLILFALLFYKERMVLPDSANYVFELVTNGGRFAVFHQRFPVVFTQLLPFTAIKLGAALDTVARLYSLNVVLFSFGCYLLCGIRYKAYGAALALLLSSLLFTTFSFFWMVSELTPGIALAFVAFAILYTEKDNSQRSGWLIYAELCIISVAAVYLHTLTIFVMGFMLVYLWLDQVHKRPLLIYSGCMLAAAIVFKLIFRDEYDQHAFGGLRNFVRLYPDYFHTKSMRQFLNHCSGSYAWVPIVFLVNMGVYIYSGRWWKACFLTASCVGYLLVITVSFPDAGLIDLYQENVLQPLATFLAISLTCDAFRLLNRVVLTTGLVALIIGTCLLRIWDTHHFFEARINRQRELIRQYDGRKVILPEDVFQKDTLMMAWSAPYEIWLLSTMEGDKTASIIITSEPKRYDEMHGSRIFVTPFGTYPYKDLPEPYFKFRDTVSRYEKLVHKDDAF